MKTIAFYSYKGGVGRTLALVNIANRLAEFGKKVCIMDFDLEAPGLDCKYKQYIQPNTHKKGLVDYIYKFAVNDEVDNINDYVVKIQLHSTKEKINLISAGDSSAGEYWKKLSRINWYDLFYEKEKMGIQFFLNMKEQIRETIKPDYLLIDNRTGITETSSLTMSLLAERIVVLAANNYENIIGAQRIVDSLTKPENNLLDIEREIHFVLTRMPMPDINKPDEKTKNDIITKQRFNQIEAIADRNNNKLASTNVIHSDRRLEENEQVGIYVDYNYAKSELDNEYFKLYNSLTKNDISESEKKAFEREKVFQQEMESLVLAYMRGNGIEFWKPSERMIEKYAKENVRLIRIRDIRMSFYWKNNQMKEVLKECDFILKIDENNYRALIVKAKAYFTMGKYKEAYNTISLFKNDQLIDVEDKLFKIRIEWYYLPRTSLNIDNRLSDLNTLINQAPQEPVVYNEKACILRALGKYEEALENVYKALQIDTEYFFAYSTLAEIKYEQKDINEFYRNFELSLKYGYEVKYVIQDEVLSIYKNVVEEEQFQNILRKYNQESAIHLIREAKLHVHE